MREDVEIRNRRRESTYALAVAVVVGTVLRDGKHSQSAQPSPAAQSRCPPAQVPPQPKGIHTGQEESDERDRATLGVRCEGPD